MTSTISRMLATQTKRPMVDRTITLDGIVEAHRHSTPAAIAATSSYA